ncbi:MAG TPA: protein kinase [Streptosporangiaceae bacterium]|nr:protein kinase [Streptosporangiaceae bacterium]
MHPLGDTGRVIAGRYRLEAPIGRGAMGVVWRARDQLLDRDVAVKEVQIAETLTDEEKANAYQRTLREAKTAARLSHPGVVTVYDVAEDGGRPWIVMQLVSAQSLDQVLAASGPLSPRRTAEMGRQLLAALSVAHAAGVMHRDVKPSNVLLGRDDRAVLTDFGIATFQGDPRLTQTGMVMGSPGFTAPERIRGEDASPASDLWSLGATLYAAVEGHGPFEKRGGAITTMSAIINEDAPEAPTAGALGPVIAALLRREPADRPDASEAARMITDVLPRLADRTPGAQAGYEPTALSAPARSAPPQPGPAYPGSAQPGSAQPGSAQPGSAQPGPVRPWSPQPGETSVDIPSAEHTITKGPSGSSAAETGPPASQPSAAQTAPTAPQPVQGGTPRYGQSPGSPPDFSSWYGSSRRSGAAAPGSGAAWSGSPASQPGSGWSGASPGQAGHDQAGHDRAAWSGSASQQAPGSAPWSGTGYEPDRRQRSGLRWKAAVVALAIIGAGAGAATVVLFQQNHSGSPQGQASSPGSTGATLPPASLQIVDAVNMPNTGPLPSGFTAISQRAAANETAGFSIAKPTSWKESTSSYQAYLRDPAIPDASILIDLTPHTYPNDMLREAEYIESQSIPHFPGYQRVDLRAWTIRGRSGSFWKFTWTNQGVSQEALDLLFVLRTSAGPQSYALYMTAPTASFGQLRSTFDEEVETFRPLTG